MIQYILIVYKQWEKYEKRYFVKVVFIIIYDYNFHNTYN